jgi:hypothetical protein
MHAINLAQLRKKNYFDEAVSVIKKTGLSDLLAIKCDYNP